MKKNILNKRVHDSIKAIDYVVNSGEEVVIMLDDYFENSKKCDYGFVIWLREAIKCRDNVKNLIESFEKSNLEFPELSLQINRLNKVIDVVSKNYDYVQERKWALEMLNGLKENFVSFNNRFEVLSLGIKTMSLPNLYMEAYSKKIDSLLLLGSFMREKIVRLKTQTKYFSSYSTFDIDEALSKIDDKLDKLENVYKPIFNTEDYIKGIPLNISKSETVSKKVKVNS